MAFSYLVRMFPGHNMQRSSAMYTQFFKSQTDQYVVVRSMASMLIVQYLKHIVKIGINF